jgi:hypothetical protein
MSGIPTRCGSLEKTNFSMTRVWSWLLWISLRAIRESWSKDTLEGRRGSVNLWSNYKELDSLITVLLMIYLFMLPKLSP